MSERSKRLPIVEVEWVDSASRGRWGGREEYLKHGPSVCRTAGYLLDETKTHLTIVQSLDDQDQMVDAIAIPRACVTRRRTVRRAPR